MKLTITNKKENKLLARMEVQGQIVFTATTPSNNDVALALSQELKVDLPLIVVKSIHTKFGAKTAEVSAYAYHALDVKQKTEPVTSHMRKKIEEEKKKAAEVKA